MHFACLNHSILLPTFRFGILLSEKNRGEKTVAYKMNKSDFMKSIYLVKPVLKFFSMTTTMCFVVTTSLAQDIRWQTDGVGQVVATHILQAGANSISTNNLSNGIYYTISDPNTSEPVTGKLVVK